MSKTYKYICPCKDCNARIVNCHSICKEYKDWLKRGIEIDKKPFFETKTRRRK